MYSSIKIFIDMDSQVRHLRLAVIILLSPAWLTRFKWMEGETTYLVGREEGWVHLISTSMSTPIACLLLHTSNSLAHVTTLSITLAVDVVPVARVMVQLSAVLRVLPVVGLVVTPVSEVDSRLVGPLEFSLKLPVKTIHIT